MRYFLLLLLAAGVLACSKNSEAAGKTIYSKCLDHNLPADTEVHILGAYEGGDKGVIEEPVFDIVPGKITLTASGDAPPRLYIVTAYEEVTWDFAHIKADRLAGVIAYGYEIQTLINVPAGVPVASGAFYARKGRVKKAARPECGGIAPAYKGGPELDALVEQVESATGLKVTQFSGQYEPKFIDLDDPKPHQGVAKKRVPHRIEDWGVGADRWQRIVADGYIRLADQSDIDAWNRIGTKRLKSGHLAPFISDRLILGRTYVVLKDWVVPSDMAGANSRVFIVPEDVNLPTSPNGHATFFLVSDGSCIGPDADCELKLEENYD